MRLLIPLFSPATGSWGGMTRVTAIADAAIAAGHQVAFCASGYLESALRKRGYQVYPSPATTMLGLPRPISRVLERRSQRVSLPVGSGRSIGSIWLVLAVSGLAREGYLSRLVEAEAEAAREFGADGLFTDLDPGAFLLSAIQGIPIASSYASVMQEGIGSIPWRLMYRAMAGVLRRNGKEALSPDIVCFGPRVTKIIPSIPELDGADPNRPDIHYVGHLLGGVETSPGNVSCPEEGKRYVFGYVGTGSISLDSLKRVLPELFPEDGNLRCIVGAQTLDRIERVGGVEFRPYVDAEALLPHCDWTICHGGQNTIIQSLLNGVPLLVFPGPIFERRFNARKVEECGAGVMGEMDQFRPEWLRATMERQAELAQGAAGLGAKIRAHGGAPAAIQAIEERFGAGTI